MHLARGAVFAGYAIERLLGAGGMGTVYLARHPRLPRSYALKVLSRELSADPEFSARFEREADLAARLDHPNVVSVHDRGVFEGQLWISMQFVDGQDCEQVLTESGGVLAPDRAVRIVGEVAAALDFAHHHGLVHRDVKPANILLASSHDGHTPERVLLTDFGIAKAMDDAAKLTRTGAVLATFDYASPEQIAGEHLDGRSDVYSLGCLLYKLVTGSVPYPGTNVAVPINGHLHDPPPRPTDAVPWLPPAFDSVVATAMAKQPTERFATCRALALAAQDALGSYAPPPPPPYVLTVSGPRRGTGPVDSRLLSPEHEQLIGERLRTSRFFDLPERLDGETGTGAPDVELSVGAPSTGRTHRVTWSTTGRRPPELDELTTMAATTTPAVAAPAPPTVVERPGEHAAPPQTPVVLAKPPPPQPRLLIEVPPRPPRPARSAGPAWVPAPASDDEDEFGEPLAQFGGRPLRGLAAIAVALALVGILVGGLWAVLPSGDDPSGSDGTAGTAGTDAADASAANVVTGPLTTSCTYALDNSGNPSNVDVGTPPNPGATPAEGAATLLMSTDQGDLTLTLDRAEAPCAAASFVHLAQSGFFDGSRCHRLVNQESFGVLQCGDPTGTGSGGPSYRYAEEVTAATTYPRGTVAMAKSSAPNSTGSQFFLCVVDSQLPPEYTVVGTVDAAGLQVLDTVAAGGILDVGPQGDGAPAIPIEIEAMTVVS